MNLKKETPAADRRRLESFYRRYNRREFVDLDPVGFLYRYPDVGDREIVALVASSLAYGRVAQIFSSVQRALELMPSPHEFLRKSSLQSLRRRFAGFRHRFSTGRELAALLHGVKKSIAEHGSLKAAFLSCAGRNDETILPALEAFTERISGNGSCPVGSLIPSARRGSACKRLNLFLRWMVREDDVDPGGWPEVEASRLLIPLDTHMHRICRGLGFTRRAQADMRTALQATSAFRRIVPGDPVRYDFTLTRLGMSGDTAWKTLRPVGPADGAVNPKGTP